MNRLKKDLPAHGAQKVVGINQGDATEKKSFVGMRGGCPEAAPVELTPRSDLQVDEACQNGQNCSRDDELFLFHFQGVRCRTHKKQRASPGRARSPLL